MEFNEGDIVEVWRKDEWTFGSWWSAKIISTYGHTCCVRYEQIANSDGKKIVNAVDIENLRPLQAPCFGRGGSLMAGHMVEVFDDFCWRVVEVIKVLPSEWLLVRFGSSDECTQIHRTEIRIPQMCSVRKWVSLGKDGNMKSSDGKELQIDEKCHTRFKTHSRKGSISEEFVGDNFGGDIVNPPTKKSRDSKRSRGSVPEPWYGKANGHALYKRKMRRTEEVGACKGSVMSMFSPLPKKVDAVSFVETHVLEKHLHTFLNGQTPGSYVTDVAREYLNGYSPSCFLRPVNVSEESRCSSVASCSSENLLSSTYNRRGAGIRKSLECHYENDATSTFESRTGEIYLGASGKRLAVNVHELELREYCSTLRALYASGPLNWDQEAILTDLRLFLNISNDEHLYQLRNILTSHC